MLFWLYRDSKIFIETLCGCATKYCIDCIKYMNNRCCVCKNILSTSKIPISHIHAPISPIHIHVSLPVPLHVHVSLPVQPVQNNEFNFNDIPENGNIIKVYSFSYNAYKHYH